LGSSFNLAEVFTGHLRIRHKEFVFALAGDYLEAGKSISGKRRLSLLPFPRESSIRTSCIGPESSSQVLFRFPSWRELT
jgi:hypothetical protein